MINRDITILVFSRTGAGKSLVANIIADALEASGLGEVFSFEDDGSFLSNVPEEYDVRKDLLLQNLAGQMRFRIMAQATNRNGYALQNFSVAGSLVLPFDNHNLNPVKRWP